MTSKRTAGVASLIAWAKFHGCEVKISRTGHYRVTWRGVLVGSFAKTPGDRRSQKNSRAFLQRRLKQIKEGSTR